MKTLKEIQQHFKFAKEVKCLSDGMTYKLTNKLINNIKFYENVIIASSKGIEIVLVEKYNFATITSYKDKKLIKLISKYAIDPFATKEEGQIILEIKILNKSYYITKDNYEKVLGAEINIIK